MCTEAAPQKGGGLGVEDTCRAQGQGLGEWGSKESMWPVGRDERMHRSNVF